MKNYRNKMAALRVTTWAGYDASASHYYGKLSFYDGDEYQSIELERTPTEEDRKKHLEETGWKLHEDTPMVKFDTYEDLKKEAIKEYKNLFPEAEILLEGGGYAQPEEILDAPTKELFTEGNRIYDEAEKSGGWDVNEKLMEELVEEWEELFGYNRGKEQ